MKRFLFLALVALMMLPTACKRHTVIPDDELAAIFHDAYLTNAYIDFRHPKKDSLNIYAPIFARYGYTTEDVQYTIGNFSRRKSARLSDVVEMAIDQLEEEGKFYDREVAILDTVKQVALRTAKEVVLQDSLIRVTRLRDTTKLQFVFDTKVGEYELSYEYEIDSLDKNNRIQRHTWMEKTDSTKQGLQRATLRRNYADRFARTFRTDSSTRRLYLNLMVIPSKPKQPSMTVRNLRITYTPTEEEAIRQLYDRQLPIRIFAEEFIAAARAKDSL